MLKITFDLTAAAALIGLSAPLMAAISVIAAAESGAAPIYIHDRIGLNGSHIKLFKFRSMKAGSDEIEAVLNDKDLEKYYQEYKLRCDHRVTKSGRWLRKTSLDELPQFFNVLLGDMSLVGPRPITEGELEFYSEEEQKRLLSVKPGITGLWQVTGRSDADYQSGRRQELELYYVDHASLILDLAILLKTPAAIISRKGAY